MRAEREMIKRENKPFDVEINKAEFVKKKKKKNERARDGNVKNTPTYACASEMSGTKNTERENKRNERSASVLERVIYIDSDESSRAKPHYTYADTCGFAHKATRNRAPLLFSF